MTRRDALALIGALTHGLNPAGLAAVPVIAGQEPSSAITGLSLARLADRLRTGRLSAPEVVEAYLSRIERLNPDLNAYVTVTAERARAAARELAGVFGQTGGRPTMPLAGVPMAHKDLFDTAGVRTAGGSRLYFDRVPRVDAALVSRLATAGAVTLGKTNTHELGGGVTTINPFFGPTRNPRDRTRVPGGSSGGSAAAVTAALAAAATGSDTGGSVRIPAAFCGCVGFKPTYGLIETTGLLGASPTFDHVGLLTRTVEDVQMLCQAIGALAADGGRPSKAARLPQARTADLRGVRIGVPHSYFHEGLDDEVADAVDSALGSLRGAGAEIQPIELPLDDATFSLVFDPIVVSEIRDTYEEQWRERPDAFSSEFAAVFSGPRPSPAAVAAAHAARSQFERRMAAVMSRVSVVAAATVPITAPRIGDPVDGARVLRNTWPFNAAHAPALSLPCGAPSGLPVGLQLAASPGRDAVLLEVAHQVETCLDRARTP